MYVSNDFVNFFFCWKIPFFGRTLRGTRAESFSEKKSWRNHLRHTSVDSVLYADSKNVISFITNPSLLIETSDILVKNSKKYSVLGYFVSGQSFLSREHIRFCSFWKGLSNEGCQKKCSFHFWMKNSFGRRGCIPVPYKVESVLLTQQAR